MPAAERLRWVQEPTWVSACGRFTISIEFHCGTTYQLLQDSKDGSAHLCRSVDSAKALARSRVKG